MTFTIARCSHILHLRRILGGHSLAPFKTILEADAVLALFLCLGCCILDPIFAYLKKQVEF